MAAVQALPERLFGDEACTDLRRAASKSRIHSFIASHERWNGGSALGASLNSKTAQSRSEVGSQAFLCRRINFVEYVVSK